jgi:metal-responsive CopG/Arc/MetJ family transcriptional regulator
VSVRTSHDEPGLGGAIRLAVSVDKEIVGVLDGLVEQGRAANRSAAIELLARAWVAGTASATSSDPDS